MDQPIKTDALIVEAVEKIRDRFGVYGLRDLIALAEHEIVVAEQATEELAQDEDSGRSG